MASVWTQTRVFVMMDIMAHTVNYIIVSISSSTIQMFAVNMVIVHILTNAIVKMVTHLMTVLFQFAMVTTLQILIPVLLMDNVSPPICATVPMNIQVTFVTFQFVLEFLQPTNLFVMDTATVPIQTIVHVSMVSHLATASCQCAMDTTPQMLKFALHMANASIQSCVNAQLGIPQKIVQFLFVLAFIS